MDAKKMFRVLVLGGSALGLGGLACGGNGGSGSGGSGGGGGGGGGTDGGGGGSCVCTKDPTWPGNDCGPMGGTMVCCWLHPTAQCCPGTGGGGGGGGY